MTTAPAKRRFLVAFSLLEVVVAIGIFAAGVVSVVGLLGGLAKSIGANADAAIAANLGDLLQAHLQSRAAKQGSLEAVAALMPATPNSLAADSRVLFASRDGTRIGEDSDPIWAGGAADQFYAITLRPIESSGGTSSLVIPYVAEVRWPAQAQGGTAAGSVPSQPGVSLIGAVSR